MPKKKEEAPQDQLDKILAAYEAKYGEPGGPRLVKMGNEIDDPSRLSTGSLELDFAMGGGFPTGRIGRLWGTKSSGKTLTSLNIISDAQSKGMKCAYVNAEKQFHEGFAKMQGIETKELYVPDVNVIEQCCTLLHDTLPHIDLFVVDSASSLYSQAEAEADIEQNLPMKRALAWTNGMFHVLDAFDYTHNTIIFIDQVRVGKIAGTGMVGGENPPGGNAIGHHSSMTAKFTPGKWLFKSGNHLTDNDDAAEVTVSGQKEPRGREIKVRVEKSRVGAPFRTATLWLDFNGMRYDPWFEYQKWGTHLGIIEKNGSWYQIGNHKVQGSNKLRDLIIEDKDLQKEIKDLVLANA